MTKEQLYRKALFDIMKSLPLCDHIGDVFDYVADDLPFFNNETEEEQETPAEETTDSDSEE